MCSKVTLKNIADIFPYISYHYTDEKHMGNVILFVTQIAVLANIAFPLTENFATY